MNEVIQSWKEESRSRKLQDLCVLVTVLVELVFFSPLAQRAGVAWLLADYFLVIPSGAFLLLGLARGIRRKGRAPMVLGLMMLAWIVLVEIFRLIFGMKPVAPGEITCYYALALPMAFALDDGRRQWGMNALAAIFLLEGVRLCVLAAGLIFGFLPDGYSEYVRWDGARLVQMFHPTTCAMLLMLGMGFSLALCLRTKNHWLQLLLIALTVMQFVVQSMTNGRNAAGFTCLMLGGILFCVIRGTGWKRAPIALVAGVVVTALLFLGFQRLYAVHEQDMTQTAVQAAQASQPAQVDQAATEPQGQAGIKIPQINENGNLVMENVQQTLRQDLFTFNGRTNIWREAVRGALRNPTILLCGTDSVAEVLAEGGSISAEHTHNSYLETLYTLGLPGLLLGLAITALALRAGLILLWRNTDLWKSSVAMITLCLLGCSLLEPYLFAAKNYHHYLCVFFLTAVGYLHQWCSDLE